MTMGRGIMNKRAGHVLGMMILVMVPTLGAAFDTTQIGWMLAAPDGGCTDLSVIRNKTLDLLAWNSPEEFVNSLRARNENVSTLTAKVEPGYMVKVVVPGRDIDVVFVPFQVCRAMWQEKLQRYSP
jgi:hypothetical protein